MEKSEIFKLVSVGFAAALIGMGITNYLLNDETIDASFVSSNDTLAEVSLEVADTSSERRKGLMNRTSLTKNHGMLFKYQEDDDRWFWMKNTYIPLDIIFLDSNYTVINIEKAEPEPNTAEENLASYRSEEPAQYVVELNQGFAENHSISKGDRLRIEK
ncbi:MAG: DUF192 domain-containing protein [Nanohaloarchaea archaeon]|nr:DUF192 domain-containing protein [Candidatus Nanohaloarchaea archaeon]